MAGLGCHVHETLEFSSPFLRGILPRSMISLFICFPYKYFGLMKEETFPQCEPDEELFGMYGKTFLYRKSTGGFGLRIELPSIWCLFP